VTRKPHGGGSQTARTGKLAATRIWPTPPPPLPACDRTSLEHRSALTEAPASPEIRPLILSVVPPKTRKEHGKPQKNEELAPHCVSVRVSAFRLLHQSRRMLRASWKLRCGLRAPRTDDGYPLSPEPPRAWTQRQRTKRRTTHLRKRSAPIPGRSRRHSPEIQRGQNVSNRPSAHRPATAACPSTPAVVPGSRRRPACNIPLRADRRRVLAANPGLSAPAEFSGALINTITIQEGTEKRGLYPRYVSVRVSRIPRVPAPPPTTFGDALRPPQSRGALTTDHSATGAIGTLRDVPQNAIIHHTHCLRHRRHVRSDATVASI